MSGGAARRITGVRSIRDCAERFCLGVGQLVQPIQVGAAQLVQAGERELHLRLDTGRSGHSARA